MIVMSRTHGNFGTVIFMAVTEHAFRVSCLTNCFLNLHVTAKVKNNELYIKAMLCGIGHQSGV